MTHAEWRAALEQLFDEVEISQFELSDVEAIYLDEQDGVFSGWLSVEDTLRLDADPDPQSDGDPLLFHARDEHGAGSWKLVFIEIPEYQPDDQ